MTREESDEKSILRQQSGGVVVLVAVMLSLLVTVLGATVDAVRLYTVRAKAQQAADAALLGGLSTALTTNLAGETLRIFRANFPDGYMGTAVGAVTVTPESATNFRVSVPITVPTPIMSIFGFDGVNMVVSARASMGSALSAGRNLELALVVDNAGSGGVGNVRTAINNLRNVVYPNSGGTYNNIRLHVVPHDVSVNLGRNRLSWIRTTRPPGASAATTWRTWYNQYHNLAGGSNYFISNRNADAPPDTLEDVSDAAPTTDSTRFRVPYSNMVEISIPNIRCFIILPLGIHTRLGCFTSGNPLSVSIGSTVSTIFGRCNGHRVVARTATYIDLDGGINYSDCNPFGAPNPIQFFFSGPAAATTPDVVELTLTPMGFGANSRSSLNAMTANLAATGGNRRINVGLMWGWFTLSPNWQGLFSASLPGLPANSGPLTSKHLILIVRGKNNVYTGQPNRPHDDTTTAALCNAIKARGITIYTIGFNNSPANLNTTLLQNCASSPNYYFYAGNAAGLDNAFTAIAAFLQAQTLRLIE